MAPRRRERRAYQRSVTHRASLESTKSASRTTGHSMFMTVLQRNRSEVDALIADDSRHPREGTRRRRTPSSARVDRASADPSLQRERVWIQLRRRATDGRARMRSSAPRSVVDGRTEMRDCARASVAVRTKTRASWWRGPSRRGGREVAAGATYVEARSSSARSLGIPSHAIVGLASRPPRRPRAGCVERGAAVATIEEKQRSVRGSGDGRPRNAGPGGDWTLFVTPRVRCERGQGFCRPTQTTSDIAAGRGRGAGSRSAADALYEGTEGAERGSSIE